MNSFTNIFLKNCNKKGAINVERQLCAYCAIYDDTVQQLDAPDLDVFGKVHECLAENAYLAATVSHKESLQSIISCLPPNETSQ